MKKIHYKKLLLVLTISVMMPLSQAYAELMPFAVSGDLPQPWLLNNLTMNPASSFVIDPDLSSQVVGMPGLPSRGETVKWVLSSELPADTPTERMALASAVEDDLLTEQFAEESGIVPGTPQHKFWTVGRLMVAGVLASLMLVVFLLMGGSGHGGGVSGFGGGGLGNPGGPMGNPNLPPIIPNNGGGPVFVPDPVLLGQDGDPNHNPLTGGGATGQGSGDRDYAGDPRIPQNPEPMTIFLVALGLIIPMIRKKTT